MVEPTKIPLRQLDLGAISYFTVSPESTPGNQVVVEAGFLYSGGYAILDQSAAPQTSPAFAPVTGGPGDEQRYDLVYLDATGTVAVQQGNGQALGPTYNGAPGLSGGPDLVDAAIPIALVFVDETGAVVVEADDIILLGGQFQVTRDLVGYLVDKGFFGAAPSGTSDDVSAVFAGETPGGSTTQRGIVTTSPLNYVHITDQNNDQILHGTGAEVYGRITEAAGVWTLSYYYQDASGFEQTVDPSSLSPAPTDVRLLGTPKVYSRNDPARPLFPSSVARLSDQVAGDIPDGTETQKGKVQFAADSDTASLEAVQGNDSRVNTPIQAEDSGGNPVGTRFSHLKAGANITLSDAGGGRVGIAAAGAAAGVTSLSPGAKTGAVNLTSGAGMSVADAGGQNISITRSAPRVRGHFTATASCGPSASAVFNHGLGGSLGDYQITGMVTNDNGHDPILNTPYFFGVSGGIFCGRIHNITTATVWMRNDNASTGMTGRVNVTRIA